MRNKVIVKYSSNGMYNVELSLIPRPHWRRKKWPRYEATLVLWFVAIHVAKININCVKVAVVLTFNLIEAFTRCTPGGGLWLADVWAGRLQCCTPDTKAYAE